MTKRAIALLLLALASPCAVRAQTPGFTVEKHVLKSAELGEEREVWVGLPPGYASGRDRYQVLYVLDADGLFQPATAYAYYLPLGGSMPPVIVVGVRSKSTADRTRNFTPPATEGSTARPGTGGADRFLAFLTKELRPLVDRQYRTQPFATLAGHSMAGLFAVYAMAREPRGFDAYFAFSPTLAWDKGSTVGRYAESLSGSKPAGKFLYLSAAVEPQFPQEPTLELTRLLKERAGSAVQWKYATFQGEDHFTTVPPALWDAMRWLYGDWAVKDYGAATPESLDAHYKQLSAKFGYPIPLPESAINLHGYTLIGSKKTKEAVRAFLFYADRYPASPDAWDGLADAYEADGRLPEAKEAIEKAVRLSGDAHPNRQVYLEHRDRIDALLRKG
jgi:uncharacterized protein